MFRVCTGVVCSISLLFDYMRMHFPLRPWSIPGVPSIQALPDFLITAHHLCVLLRFIKPILENLYGPGVSSCQQTSDDNNLGVAGSSPLT